MAAVSSDFFTPTTLNTQLGATNSDKLKEMRII